MITSSTAISLLFLLAVQGIYGLDGVKVTVKQGTLVGAQQKAVTGKSFYSFKGIPFALPPVGELRFQAPQPPVSWNGERDATKHGAICPQFDILQNVYLPGDEDCLFLNVYTPEITPEKPLPVIFHIYGGTYKFGSGNDDMYGPDFLVSGGVILVTSNHRLDSLGFLSTEDCVIPGNAGLKDQLAALKWVRENIDQFGGDPQRITLMGGASGGASIAFHLTSSVSKDLFQSAVISSGAPHNDFSWPYQPARRAFKLGQLNGIETNNSTELLKSLQKVPVKDLINRKAFVLPAEELTNIPFKWQSFTPIVEKQCPQDTLVTIDPYDAIKAGKINKDVKIMWGYNNAETLILAGLYATNLLPVYESYPTMFCTSRLASQCTSDTLIKVSEKIIKYYFGDKPVAVENLAEFINYASNASIAIEMQKLFRSLPKEVTSYFYKFSSYSERNCYGGAGAPYNLTGAAHFDEACYIFDPKSRNNNLDKSSNIYKMIMDITTSVVNFAKTGNPTPDSSLGVIWPKFDNKNLAYMDFGESMNVGYAPDNDDYIFWTNLEKEIPTC